MSTKISNPEDVDAARDRVRADRLIDSIDKAFQPERLSKLAKPLAPHIAIDSIDWHDGDRFTAAIRVGDDALFTARGWMDEDGVTVISVCVVGAETEELGLSAAGEKKLELLIAEKAAGL